MQVLHAVVLGGAAVCCLGALLFAVGKVLALLLRCYQAKRQFLSSPIPGPSLSSYLFGALHACATLPATCDLVLTCICDACASHHDRMMEVFTVLQ